MEARAPGQGLQQTLHRLVECWNRECNAIYRQQQQRGNQLITPPPPIPRELAEQTFQVLQSWVYRQSRYPVELARRWTVHWGWGIDTRRLLRPLLRHPELSLLHFVRLMVLLGQIDPATTASPQRYRTIGPGIDAYLRRYRASHAPPCGLQELAAAFTAAGLDDRCIGWARLLSERRRPRLNLEDDATWPYFAVRPWLLSEVLVLPADDLRFDRRTRRTIRHNALQIIAMMPSPPVPLHELLWQIVLSGSRAERAPAQAALERLGDRRPLVAALGSTRWQDRAAAADWLGRIAGSEAGEARRELTASLQQALQVERSQRVRAVLRQQLQELQPGAEQIAAGDGSARDQVSQGMDRKPGPPRRVVPERRAQP